MKRKNLFVRITAIVLCAIMVLSVVTAALYAFAAEAGAPSPATGSPDKTTTLIIIAVVVAAVVVAGCLIIPKLKK